MSQNIKVNPDILEQKVLVNVEDLKLMCPFKVDVFSCYNVRLILKHFLLTSNENNIFAQIFLIITWSPYLQ